jgi:hypothetical protein
MPKPREQAWFRAKRYGYGWGWPATWQGWGVLLGYFAVLGLSGVAFLPERLPAFLCVTVLFSVVLLGICFWKGETPRWRWREDP